MEKRPRNESAPAPANAAGASKKLKVESPPKNLPIRLRNFTEKVQAAKKDPTAENDKKLIDYYNNLKQGNGGLELIDSHPELRRGVRYAFDRQQLRGQIGQIGQLREIPKHLRSEELIELFGRPNLRNKALLTRLFRALNPEQQDLLKDLRLKVYEAAYNTYISSPIYKLIHYGDALNSKKLIEYFKKLDPSEKVYLKKFHQDRYNEAFASLLLTGAHTKKR